MSAHSREGCSTQARSRLRYSSRPVSTPPAPSTTGAEVTRRAALGFCLAAIGRPPYIATGREGNLGDLPSRTIEMMDAHAHELLDLAWELDVRYIDVARSFGRAESFLGSWLALHPARREQLIISSTWGYEYVSDWTADAQVHETKNHSRAMLNKQWPETLDAIDGNPDIYLIPSVTPDSPALTDRALLDQLSVLRDTGKRVGISTGGPRQAEVIEQALNLRDHPFSVVQATWNILESSAAPALRRASRAGWTTVLKEVLANGALTDGSGDAGVKELARDEGTPVEEFAFATAFAEPWADIVLSAATTRSQLRLGATVGPGRLHAQIRQELAMDPDLYWQLRPQRGWT